MVLPKINGFTIRNSESCLSFTMFAEGILLSCELAARGRRRPGEVPRLWRFLAGGDEKSKIFSKLA